MEYQCLVHGTTHRRLRKEKTQTQYHLDSWGFTRLYRKKPRIMCWGCYSRGCVWHLGRFKWNGKDGKV